MSDPRLVRRLLRLYPAPWRERYAEEFAGVLVASLADGDPRRRRRWRVVLDVLAGAADAHLNAPAHRRADPARNPACLAFCAFVLFCLAGTGFQKMTEDRAFHAAARAHAAIGWSFRLVVAGAIAAALFAVAGSLPVGLAVVRQAAAGRRDLRRRLSIPPAALIAWVALVFAVTRLVGPSRVHSPANLAAFISLAGGFLVVTALSAAALVSAARRVELPATVQRTQCLPMTGLSLAMVAVTAANLVWGLSLPPSLFHSDNGLLATSLPPSWAITLGVMALASAAAVAATVRAIRAARTASLVDPQS